MDPTCKQVQLKLLLSQFDDDVRKHISECEGCWAAFMNLGVQGPSQMNAGQQKQALFAKVSDPAYQGDTRMRQFQLLSSLPLTAYAKQLFLDYFTKLELGKSRTTRDWQVILAALEDAVYERLQKKKEAFASPDQPIDAEVMMGVLDEIGEPQTFLEASALPATPDTPIRRLYRSRQERLFLGVCGGLAEYLRVDPVLVRILFVGLLFAGAVSLPLYVLLAFLVPARPNPQPIFPHSPEAPTPAPVTPRFRLPLFRWGRWLLWRMAQVCLFLVVYVPLLAVFGLLSLGSAFALFAPVWTRNVDLGVYSFSHQFFLRDLGTPALVTGASISILCFSLFMLVLSFVCKLHFRKELLGKNLSSIFIVFVVMSLFSGLVSAGLVAYEHKEVATLTKEKRFALAPNQSDLILDKEHLVPLEVGGGYLKSLKIKGDPHATAISTRVSLRTRAQSRFHARRILRGMRIKWPKSGTGKVIPEVFGAPSPKKFRFVEIRIELTMPSALLLKLERRKLQTHISGTFAHPLSLQNSAWMTLKQVHTPSLKLHNKYGKTELLGVSAKSISLFNRYGEIQGTGVKGSFSVDNRYGQVLLKVQDITSQANQVTNKEGRVRLSFPEEEIPVLSGYVRKGDDDYDVERAFNGYARSKATLAVVNRNGLLELKLWRPTDDIDEPKQVTPQSVSKQAPKKAQKAPDKANQANKSPKKAQKVSGKASKAPKKAPTSLPTGTKGAPVVTPKKSATPKATTKTVAPVQRPQPTSRPATRSSSAL